ncbi:MAG TPA: carboxypeptidase regulatory-like domain-containing protein [Verrucomicrobiae bacterium]|nr:carboxypeptidase regulatory-like domain-containing protein [Verrucomicrobiae bacterium]
MKSIKVSTVLFSLVLAALPSLRAADIIGTITFKGTPPKEIPLTAMESSPDCMAMHKTLPTTQHYVIGAKGELANVTVSLKDADGKAITGKSTGASAAPAMLDQKGCLYTPTILAIQTGQKLLVRNSDSCIHNVHTTSTAGNTDHNDAQMAGAPDLTYTFDKPEMYLTFRCDVHPWMFAWVSIFDNPYFCVSGTDGKFVIKNVPPGKYTVVANHRKFGEQTQVVTVSDKDVTVDFTFEAK